LAPAFVGRGEAEIECGVPDDELAELAAGVAAGAEDAHRDFMHDRCIVMQRG
jgi:hypothetical protein